MSEEFNKEFLKLSEKDQKAILNLIQLKNMNKKTEYKQRIDKAKNELTILIQIIMDQPSNNAAEDLWLIERLNGISMILEGNEESNE